MYIIRIPEESNNAMWDIVYSAIGVKSLRTARANNIPDSFSTAANSLLTRMNRQRVPNEKKKQTLNKYQEDFDVCKSKQERLELVFYVIILFSFYLFRPTSKIGCYSCRQDGNTCFLCTKNK